ncbi:MAG: small multi-drug export protein [Clostridia bacterium]|nr:small multi-drug export protein [Clostridia bacterium]
MAEGLADSIVGFLNGKIPPELIVFVISLLPILELRGGLIAAKILNIGLLKAFGICFVGNMLPIPFILLFIRKIFDFLKKSEKIGSMLGKLEERSLKKGEKVKKYKMWGLFILVAIPLPGTGGWTGALVADLLNIKIRHSLPTIAAGVLVAGIIVSAVSYGLFGVLGF